MSLNYWFHLVQSMTCRCASLNVYGFYLAWPLTRCVCEGAFAPPLVGDSFFFSSSSLIPFFIPLSFFTLLISTLIPVRSKTLSSGCAFDLDVSENHVGSNTPQSRAVSRGLKRPQSGPKTVPSGILEPESRVPQAGGDWSGYLGAAKQPPPLDSALSLLFCFSPGWSPLPPPCYFFFSVCPANTQGPRL